MDFDDLKVTWDSQSEELLYSVNEDGLRAVLRKKHQEFKRLVYWQELQTYGSSLLFVTVVSIAFIAGFMEMFQPETTRWDSLALLLAASGWLYFGGKIYVGRKKQEQRERKFTSSLRDELDRDIAQVEYQISSRKHIVLGFIPPYAGAILFMWVVFRMTGVTEWAVVPLTAAMIGGLVLESRSQQRLVDHKLAPRKEELESLRDKLVAKEN